MTHMTDISQYMRKLGRKGGKSRSRAKVAAGRHNIRRAWAGRSAQARRARREAGK